MINFRNNLIKDIQNSSLSPEIKIPFYLGQSKIEGNINTTLKDSTEGLLYHTDVAIHFIDLLIPRVQAIGQLTLPKAYAEKIIKHEIVCKYKDLIPPKNFIEGLE